jgi:hypothetical protein
MALQLPRWRAGALPRPAPPPLRRRAARAGGRSAARAAAPPPDAPGDAAAPPPNKSDTIVRVVKLRKLSDGRELIHSCQGRATLATVAPGAVPPPLTPLTKERLLALRAMVLAAFCDYTEAAAREAAANAAFPAVDDLDFHDTGNDSAEAHARQRQWATTCATVAALWKRVARKRHALDGKQQPLGGGAVVDAPIPVACAPVLLAQPLPPQRFSWSSMRYVAPLERMIATATTQLARASAEVARLSSGGGGDAGSEAEEEAAAAAAALADAHADGEEEEEGEETEQAAAVQPLVADADSPLGKAMATEAQWRATLAKLQESRPEEAQRDRRLRAHLSLELRIEPPSGGDDAAAAVAAVVAAKASARPRGFGGGAVRARPAAPPPPRVVAAQQDDPAATQRWRVVRTHAPALHVCIAISQFLPPLTLALACLPGRRRACARSTRLRRTPSCWPCAPPKTK